MTRKSCPFCYCINATKHGIYRGRQRYECQDCFTTWSGLTRPQRFQRRLWREYAVEGRSVAWLGKRYNRGRTFIAAQLAAYDPADPLPHPRPVVVVMDVTYFGAWGMLVVINPYARPAQNEELVLYWAVVEGTERTRDYAVATDTLEAMGYQLQAAVIDGRRGVRQMLEHKGIPVQYCQFHQLQTITQCLTKRPKLVQNQELRAIALTLTRTTKPEFTAKLDAWHNAHGAWLKERYTDPKTGRTRYQHARTRRAYFSLRRNLEYLFTYQDKTLTDKQNNQLKIPNTTNALDGRFSVWKTKLKAHRGCSKQRKITMLRSFFSRRTD